MKNHFVCLHEVRVNAYNVPTFELSLFLLVVMLNVIKQTGTRLVYEVRAGTYFLL